MSGFEVELAARTAWRDQVKPTVIGLLGLFVVAVATLGIDNPRPVPIMILVLPVMATALLGATLTTLVVGSAAVVIGLAALVSEGRFDAGALLRGAALVVGCAVAFALAIARDRREAVLAEREAALAGARNAAESDAIIVAMLESLPELGAAPDVVASAFAACQQSLRLFGPDAASYWQVEGDECVLVAQTPAHLPEGLRLPRGVMEASARAVDGSRSYWFRREHIAGQVVDTTAIELAVGTSSPVRVSGAVTAYLGLGWRLERSRPDPTWFNALDRFADQIALARIVIRRREAQEERQQIALRLQAGLLPAGTVTDSGLVIVRTEYRPGIRQLLLGGDFVDVTRTNGDVVNFILGDVSGHGPEQAALGVMLRAAWVGMSSLVGSSLEDWVGVLNGIMFERRQHNEAFATAVMGRVDPHAQTLEYVVAGHPAPFLLLPRTEALELGDPPLGIVIQPRTTRRLVKLGDTWAVLLFTDGLYEGQLRPGSKERLGLDGFQALVSDMSPEFLERPGFLRDLVDSVETLNGGMLSDDAAAMLLMSRPDPQK